MNPPHRSHEALVAAEAADVRFVIVGTAESPDERAYEARIAALARELGVADRLTFAQARRDIPAVMAALDAFVLCSRHEGFGRVVAEAMAAARPIVVTDEGALPELVDSGRLGLVAPPEDPAGFAGGILALLRDANSMSRSSPGASPPATAPWSDWDARRFVQAFGFSAMMRLWPSPMGA